MLFRSRTSLAAGIPLIYAYKDPAFEGNEPFALRIEDRQQQTSSTLVKITNFIRKASIDPDLGLKAWKFAQNNLDIDILEKRRIRFFNSIIESLSMENDFIIILNFQFYHLRKNK